MKSNRIAPVVRAGPWAPTLGSCGASTTLEHALVTSAGQRGENSSIASDDFNSCSLDADVWTFTDPVDDATYSMTGTFTQDAWLSISVPGGEVEHNIWVDGNFAPRILQDVSDTDFELEAKFESGLSQKYQMQGVLVEQDSDHFLRLEFHSDGAGTRLYAVAFEPDPSPPPPLTYAVKHFPSRIAANDVAPLYMRVRRQGDQWTLYYSFDGVDWTSAVTFTHALTVTKVGTYAGNSVPSADSSPPAHTAYIDYIFNAASPIKPENGARATLTVSVDGSGTVSVVPDKPSYDCGDVVTLSAEPAEWFVGWSGDLTGTKNPGTVIMTGRKSVTASFSHKPQVYLPLAMTAPFSDYLFVGDFETGDLTGFFWNQNKPEVVGPPHPVRAGNRSARCYLHRYQSQYSYRTQVWASDDDSNPEGTHSAFHWEIGEEYWLGYSIYVPSDWVADIVGLSDNILSIQATPDSGEQYRSAVLSMMISESDWLILSRYDWDAYTPGPNHQGTRTHYRQALGASLGDWTDWVFHIKWSYQSDGLLEVWRNGQKVVTYNGPNCANDQRGPRLAIGIYKWPWRPEYNYPSNTDERLLYIDELRIAGVDGDYDAVAP